MNECIASPAPPAIAGIWMGAEKLYKRLSPDVFCKAVLYEKERRYGKHRRVPYRLHFRLETGRRKAFVVSDQACFSMPDSGTAGTPCYKGTELLGLTPNA